MRDDAADGVRWTGEPVRGLRFTARDAIAVPIGCVYDAFSLFQESLAARSGPTPVLAIGAIFTLAGMYLAAGRFVVDAYLRARTTYEIDDGLAIVRRGGPYPAT